jgi:hypothetical protein
LLREQLIAICEPPVDFSTGFAAVSLDYYWDPSFSLRSASLTNKILSKTTLCSQGCQFKTWSPSKAISSPSSSIEYSLNFNNLNLWLEETLMISSANEGLLRFPLQPRLSDLNNHSLFFSKQFHRYSAKPLQIYFFHFSKIS